MACCGKTTKPSVPTTSGDDQATPAASGPAPGMPRYKVIGGSADESRIFETWDEAREYKRKTGGRMRTA